MAVEVEKYDPFFNDRFSRDVFLYKERQDNHVYKNTYALKKAKRKNRTKHRHCANGTGSNNASSSHLSKRSRDIDFLLPKIKLNSNSFDNHVSLDYLPLDCASQSIIQSFVDLANIYKTSRALDDNITRWARHIKKLTKKERPLIELAIKRFKNVVKEVVPQGEVVAFGSYTSSLRLPEGDIDLTIRGARGAPKNILRNLIKHLRPLALNKNVCSILNAKTPILRYIDAVTGTRVDVNANPNTSIQSTDIVNSLLKKFPSLWLLVTINKQLIKNFDLNETSIGGVGSFLLFHMCLAFYLKFGEFCKIDGKYSDGLALICLWKYYGMLHDYYKVGIDANGEFIELPTEEQDGVLKLVAYSPVNGGVEFGKRAHQIIRVINLFRHALSTCLLITKADLKFPYSDTLQFLFSETYSKYMNKHILNGNSLINV